MMSPDFMRAFLLMSPEEQDRWIEMEEKMQNLRKERDEMSQEHERIYMLRLRFYERWGLRVATWLMSRLPRY